MAKCQDCKQEMLTAQGCKFTHIVDDKGKRYPRSLGHWQEPGERCHDCGAMYGEPHHHGCDVERCPKCGLQLIGCDCTWAKIEYEKKGKG